MDKIYYEIAFHHLPFDEAVEQCIKYAKWYVDKCIDDRMKLVQDIDLLNNYGLLPITMN